VVFAGDACNGGTATKPQGKGGASTEERLRVLLLIVMIKCKETSACLDMSSSDSVAPPCSIEACQLHSPDLQKPMQYVGRVESRTCGLVRQGSPDDLNCCPHDLKIPNEFKTPRDHMMCLKKVVLG